VTSEDSQVLSANNDSLPVVADKTKNRPGRPLGSGSSKELSPFIARLPHKYSPLLKSLSKKEKIPSSSVLLKAILGYMKTQHGVEFN
jgi:hypothetical protein